MSEAGRVHQPFCRHAEDIPLMGTGEDFTAGRPSYLKISVQ